MHKLIDLELVVVDDPLRIGQILPNGVPARLVFGRGLDKVPIKPVEQEFIQDNFTGRQDITSARTGFPRQFVVPPVANRFEDLTGFACTRSGTFGRQRLVGWRRSLYRRSRLLGNTHIAEDTQESGDRELKKTTHRNRVHQSVGTTTQLLDMSLKDSRNEVPTLGDMQEKDSMAGRANIA